MTRNNYFVAEICPGENTRLENGREKAGRVEFSNCRIIVHTHKISKSIFVDMLLSTPTFLFIFIINYYLAPTSELIEAAVFAESNNIML